MIGYDYFPQSSGHLAHIFSALFYSGLVSGVVARIIYFNKNGYVGLFSAIPVWYDSLYGELVDKPKQGTIGGFYKFFGICLTFISLIILSLIGIFDFRNIPLSINRFIEANASGVNYTAFIAGFIVIGILFFVVGWIQTFFLRAELCDKYNLPAYYKVLWAIFPLVAEMIFGFTHVADEDWHVDY